MKNSEIHNGLPEKEIRDFLSLSLVKAFEDECNNKKETIPYGGNPQHNFQWAIKDTEAQIKYMQRCLEILKTKEAVIQLIINKDWEEFDVSDETTKDTSYRIHMSFIGTKKEYEELEKKIKTK